MTPKIFVHLSDIHFGQEKGGDVYINDDAKEALLEDAHDVVAKLDGGKADGVIISGDIAYAGVPSEYEAAGRWLDRLTAAVGCEVTAVQLVPGNHDINRGHITNICQRIVDEIIHKGEAALDRYMAIEDDREVLYKKFEGYRAFAEAYNCPLDSEGIITEHRTYELAPERLIKFYGLNTALLCSNRKDEEGKLMLGARQRVIRSEPGQELIVIGHHPMNWLQDSEDALKYVQNRARVFISGHEHKPSHTIIPVEPGVEVVMISAGATVPPQADANYTYCYNILEFIWNSETDGLIINVHPRIWVDQKKRFGADTHHFPSETLTYFLHCPNFHKVARQPQKNEQQPLTPQFIDSRKSDYVHDDMHIDDNRSDKRYQHALLRFFRDLSGRQRLAILIELGSLPQNWSGSITHTVERMALDALFKNGELDKVLEITNKFLSPKIGNQTDD